MGPRATTGDAAGLTVSGEMRVREPVAVAMIDRTTSKGTPMAVATKMDGSVFDGSQTVRAVRKERGWEGSG